MYKGFGVQVTVDGVAGIDAVRPFVVVARDERDAEVVAAGAAGGGTADAEIIRELTADEARNYGLDLDRHGDAKALPVLNL